MLFVFLDGVGLGAAHANHNPLSVLKLPAFEQLLGQQCWTRDADPIATASHTFHPIDANLEMEGLPQSGTGQATLFTGINCAKVAGRHFGPFPHSRSKPILATHNIFRQIQHLDPAVEEPAAFARVHFIWVEWVDQAAHFIACSSAKP